jgi:hypothetical protein
MSCPTLIGVATDGGAFTARRLHWGGPPEHLIPILRRIWQHTYAENTPAVVEALLVYDWVELDPAPRRRHAERAVRVLPGLGYASIDPDLQPWTESVVGEAAGDLLWLYLIGPDVRAVTVYEATRTGRWLRHSLHDLAVDADGDLFAGQPGIVCLTCGAIDLVHHVELPSMTGSGTDTSTRCLRCGAAEAFDPVFGRHRTPVPWPPAATPGTPA